MLRSILHAIAVTGLIAAPMPAYAIVQDSDEAMIEFECPEDTDELPEELRNRCRGALDEAIRIAEESAGANLSTITILVPVGVLTTTAIFVASGDEDRPASR